MMMFFNAFFFEAANPLIIQNTNTNTTCRFSVFFVLFHSSLTGGERHIITITFVVDMRAKASAAKRKKSLNFSMNIASVVLFLCGVLVNTSNALREDQLGTYDWHLKFVCDVRFVSFLTGENDRNKVLVTTQDSNIIAALDQKDGTIEWRATLDESDAVDYASLEIGRASCRERV